jgi:hypothetical protein
MKSFVIFTALLILSGCTMMQPRANLPDSFASNCETRDCVVDEVDKIANDPKYPGGRFKIMEGYKDTQLRPMLEDGRLDIDYINPLWVVLGSMVGYANISFGLYGEVWKCSVRVAPWPDWSILVHELTHCQGYKDRGFLDPFAYMDVYAEKQQEIIKAEGVTSWIETEFYKNKRYITDDYIK